MQTTLINLNINNPSLSALASRQYKPGYTNVPDSALPKAIQQQLALIFRTLSGQELAPDSTTLLIKASTGTFERLYAPSLFKRSEPSEGQSKLFIKWGQTEIDLIAGTKGGIYPAYSKDASGNSSPIEGLSASFTEAEATRGKDLVLQFQLEDEASDQIVIFNTSVRLASYETKPELATLNVLAKRNVSQLADLISEAPNGGGGGGLGGDVVALKDLELGAYSVLGFRPVNTKYGTKYILHVQANSILGREADFEVWSDKTINLSLGSVPAPIVNTDKPGVLTVISKTPLADDKVRVQVSLTVSGHSSVEGGLSLDFA